MSWSGFIRLSEITAGFMLLFPLVPRAADLPRSPEVPIEADCIALALEYSELTKAAHVRVQKCMSGPAKIGDGKEIALLTVFSTCKVVDTIRAWPYCFPTEQAACEIGKAGRAETKKCYARVDASKAGTSSPKLIADVVNGGRQASETFGSAAELLRDPRKLLLTTLREKAPEIALQMFDPYGNLLRERFEDANEIYGYAVGPVADELLRSRSSTVGAIQHTVLLLISTKVSRAFGQLEVAMAQYDKQAERLTEMRATFLSVPDSEEVDTGDPYELCKRFADALEFSRCVDQAIRSTK